MQAAREREEVILKQLEEKEPLPDKEKNQIAWVRAVFLADRIGNYHVVGSSIKKEDNGNRRN